MTFKQSILPLAILLLSTSNVFSKGEHSHDFPKEIMAFHHTMAPLWHLDQGDTRTKMTCEAIAEMKNLANNIDNSKGLIKSLNNLKAVCSQKEIKIAEAFKAVHDEFHKISDKK